LSCAFFQFGLLCFDALGWTTARASGQYNLVQNPLGYVPRYPAGQGSKKPRFLEEFLGFLDFSVQIRPDAKC